MPINIPFQNDTNTSSYIVNLSKASGKTYRELKSLWDKYNREVQYDVMYNPTKYVNFGKNNLYTEVGRRLEEYLNNPTGTATEEIAQADTNQAEQSFGNEVEQNLEQPIEPTSPDVVPEEPVADGTQTPETDEAPPEAGVEGEAEPEAEPITMSDDENAQMPSEEELNDVFDEYEL